MKLTVRRTLLALTILAAAAALCWYWPFLSGFLPGLGPQSNYPAPAVRPTNWAEPLDVPTLANFHRVSEELYRGAQPTREGMKRLEAMGIRTVVNLRSIRSDRREMRPTGLDYEHIHVDVMHISNDDVVEFLGIVTDPQRTPVFVHCRHGADRTGAMCAMYRIAVCGWAKADAIDEMVNGGFGFHRQFRYLIKYIEEADIEAIKRQAGIAAGPARTGAAK